MTRSFGRVVEHDGRSRAFPAMVGPVRSVAWRHYGPVLDQGNLGSCTGNAMAQALNTAPLHRPGRLLREADAVQLYSAATVLDGFPGQYPPEDTGSSGLAVAKAAQAAGYITAYRHAFGLEHLLGALQHGPTIVGTDWHEGMSDPSPAGVVRPTGAVLGGHEWLVYGLDVKRRQILALNSWGRDWGLHGHFRIGWDDMDALLRAGGDVTVPVR